MFKVNENYLKLEDKYIFSEVKNKVEEFLKLNPETKVINLGIGDVRLPLDKTVASSMADAALELSLKDKFKGYGPEQGYKFLRDKIVDVDYNALGITADEVFISDGTKCDISDVLTLLGKKNLIGIPFPTYPVYSESNIIAGNEIFRIKASEETNFVPQVPDDKLDVIYLCMPNNPTGTVLSYDELTEWVEYAIKNNAIILYDGAYEKYITEENIPHSIYEIENAKKVAIEFRSFSKFAGFTGIRCSYMVVPNELIVMLNEKSISLNKLWKRRCGTMFNGVSYITQVGANACFSEEVYTRLKENIKYYIENSHMLKEVLEEVGFTVYGGTNSPYVWVKGREKVSSWGLWKEFLEKYNIVSTPGMGFGLEGEGYIRLSAFAKREDIQEAVRILRKM